MDARRIINDLPSPRRRVKVTQEIIDTSTVKDSSHCMIADAVAKDIPNASYISVDLATIRFTDTSAGVRYIYLTPRSAQAALLAFDAGEKPDPFTVNLEGAHVLRSGKGSKGKPYLLDREGSSRARGKTLPERRGGEAPPIGPLAGQTVSKGKAGTTPRTGRTGRTRAFGLRAIIR